MEPIEAYSNYVLGYLHSDEIVALANSWLNKGIFTESLNTLCWEKEIVMSTVGPLFEKAMVELQIHRPARIEAAQNIIRKTLTQIVKFEIKPDVGASFVYDVHLMVSDELPDKNYAGDSLGLEHIFCWIREIWDCRDGSMILYYSDLPRKDAEEKFKEHLIDESDKWLKKYATSTNGKINNESI